SSQIPRATFEQGGTPCVRQVRPQKALNQSNLFSFCRRGLPLLHLPFDSKGRAFMQGRAPINSRIHEGRASSSKRTGNAARKTKRGSQGDYKSPCLSFYLCMSARGRRLSRQQCRHAEQHFVEIEQDHIERCSAHDH